MDLVFNKIEDLLGALITFTRNTTRTWWRICFSPTRFVDTYCHDQELFRQRFILPKTFLFLGLALFFSIFTALFTSSSDFTVIKFEQLFEIITFQYGDVGSLVRRLFQMLPIYIFIFYTARWFARFIRIREEGFEDMMLYSLGMAYITLSLVYLLMTQMTRLMDVITQLPEGIVLSVLILILVLPLCLLMILLYLPTLISGPRLIHRFLTKYNAPQPLLISIGFWVYAYGVSILLFMLIDGLRAG